MGVYTHVHGLKLNELISMKFQVHAHTRNIAVPESQLDEEELRVVGNKFDIRVVDVGCKVRIVQTKNISRSQTCFKKMRWHRTLIQILDIVNHDRVGNNDQIEFPSDQKESRIVSDFSPAYLKRRMENAQETAFSRRVGFFEPFVPLASSAIPTALGAEMRTFALLCTTSDAMTAVFGEVIRKRENG